MEGFHLGYGTQLVSETPAGANLMRAMVTREPSTSSLSILQTSSATFASALATSTDAGLEDEYAEAHVAVGELVDAPGAGTAVSAAGAVAALLDACNVA